MKEQMNVGVTMGLTPEQFRERIEPTLLKLGIDSGSWSEATSGEYLDLIVKDYPANIMLVNYADKNGETRSLEYHQSMSKTANRKTRLT